MGDCKYTGQSDEGSKVCIKIDYRKTWLTGSERYNRATKKWYIRRCYDKLHFDFFDAEGNSSSEAKDICGRRIFRPQYMFCSDYKKIGYTTTNIFRFGTAVSFGIKEVKMK